MIRIPLLLLLAAAACSPPPGTGGNPDGGSTGNTDGGGGGPDGGGSTGGTDAGTRPFPASPLWQPSGTQVTWGGFSFRMPQGMTGEDKTDHFDMTDDKCAITANMAQPASGTLAQQANDLLIQAYSALGYQVLDDNYGTDLLANRTEGKTAGGWSYVELRAELRKGGPSDERGHIFLVGVGNEVVPFIGYSPTTQGCTQLAHDFKTGIIGELRWRELEFSLDFPTATKSPAALAQPVIGHWALFSGPSGQEYVFAANGRYQYWGGLSQAHVVSSTEYELVTSHFSGDGAFAVKGDQLALFPDGKPAESFLVRVFDQHAVSPSGVVSHKVQLGLMKKDAAGAYEVPLEKVP